LSETNPISKFIMNQWESLKQCAHNTNDIYLLKMCCSNGSNDVNGSIAIVLHNNDGSTPTVATMRAL
jgi:hypothetical protein